MSQMLFHHCMVTRSPNHWWAISWAITSATSFCADGGGFGIEEQSCFAVSDGAEVLHGAGFKVGQADEVEFLSG